MKSALALGRFVACRPAFFLFSVLGFLSSICQPVMAADDAADLSPLFQRVATEENVPLTLLWAIARVESKGYPYTINVEGKSFFFAGKDEAIAFAGKALAAGKSFDAGIMQINSQWLTRFRIPLDVVFDPEANIWLGGWILSRNIRQHGDLQAAVAHYHSPDPTRGSQYIRQIRAAISKGQAELTLPGSITAQPPELPAVQATATARRVAPQSQQTQAKTAPVDRFVGSSAFIFRIPKIFHRDPADQPDESAADTGFVRRYN